MRFADFWMGGIVLRKVPYKLRPNYSLTLWRHPLPKGLDLLLNVDGIKTKVQPFIKGNVVSPISLIPKYIITNQPHIDGSVITQCKISNQKPTDGFVRDTRMLAAESK
jgi:hypothetical protein